MSGRRAAPGDAYLPMIAATRRNMIAAAVTGLASAIVFFVSLIG